MKKMNFAYRALCRRAFLRKKHRTPEKMHLGELENPGGKRK